jgi:hypothetical protein
MSIRPPAAHRERAPARPPQGRAGRAAPRARVALALALLLCAGCATARAPTPSGAPPTPLPTAAPVARPAGWGEVESANWAGYTLPQGGVTGARARWQEPTTSGATGAYVLVWIGVGGWERTYDNIVQVGSWDHVAPDGSVAHRVWYETLPPNQWQISDVSVSPGDRLFASVELTQAGPPQRWHLYLLDVTTGRALDRTVTFQSLRAYASFVVEDPDATANNGPPYFALARFSPIAFEDMQVRYGAAWVSAGTVYGLRVTMEQAGRVQARPGPLSQGRGFTVERR